jgi:hypothetical protein
MSCYGRPCTRGVIPLVVAIGRHRVAVPAYAGVVRRSSWTPGRAGSSSPHTRGDPNMLNHVSSGVTCSPHTRGWSAGERQAAGHRRVVPAHARVVLNGAIKGYFWDVVPAHAGVVRPSGTRDRAG